MMWFNALQSQNKPNCNERHRLYWKSFRAELCFSSFITFAWKWNLSASCVFYVFFTRSKRGGDRVTGGVSSSGNQRQRVLGVWPQTGDAVLLLSRGDVHRGLVWGVRSGRVKHGDSVRGSHRQVPADQSRGVRHVFHLHLPGAVHLWGGKPHVKPWLKMVFRNKIVNTSKFNVIVIWSPTAKLR